MPVLIMGMLDYVVHRVAETHSKVRAALLSGDVPHWIKRSKRKRYISAIIISTPPWVDRDALKLIQYNCRCISELTGVPHGINHCVPLHHPLVCGLTVPWNLEIITAKRNNALSNHWNNDRQPDLFL